MPCLGKTSPTGVGVAVPSVVVVGQMVRLQVAVTPNASPPSTGILLDIEVLSLGGSAMQPMYDDATNGDQIFGNGFQAFLNAYGAGC